MTQVSLETLQVTAKELLCWTECVIYFKSVFWTLLQSISAHHKTRHICNSSCEWVIR